MAAGNGMETYAARLASFSVARPTKKRGSDTKGTKTLKWPLKNPSAEQLATAGFFYQPTASNPDNVECFLCDKNLDSWEEDDNPVMEHLKLSPECGWAINVSIEQQLGNGSYGSDDLENSMDEKLLDSRKMTFGSNWPHENKRGWICKTQKMIESGWYYCPTGDSDDYAKCSYCSLGLDGWEPKDDPYDEHRRRSPECIFFAFSASSKSKRGRPRKSSTSKASRMSARTSKASRMSTQSNFTTFSEVTSLEEPEAHEVESIILATAEVERPIKAARGAKKGGKPKKASAKSKAKATATKAEDPTLASSFIEPEDDNFEVKVNKTSTKSGRSKKRSSDEMNGEIDKPRSRQPSRQLPRRNTRPVVLPSPPSEEREMVDAIGVRSPSPSVSLIENALQGSSNETESMHERTPPLAEMPREIPKQLPPVQTTPPPVFSPQSSDAENQPPSSRPSAVRPPLSVKSPSNTQIVQIRSAACTPTASPSKQNVLKLQSAFRWTPAEVEILFLGSPAGNEENDPFAAGATITQSENESLSIQEKKLSMEEWIRYKARQAEERIRNECERLVGKFEGEGVRALRTLEGISCID